MEKEKDFGGCRCQAYLLAGDAANTDPVCSKSPHHEQIVQLVKQTNNERESTAAPMVFRNMCNLPFSASGCCLAKAVKKWMDAAYIEDEPLFRPVNRWDQELI